MNTKASTENRALMSGSAPGTILRRTMSTVALMLAAWAAFVGGVTVVMLVAISHAKGESPATAADTNVSSEVQAPVPTSARDALEPTQRTPRKAPARI